MTSTVASNVVALPGIGIGPHTPVRAAESATKTANTEADGHGGKHVHTLGEAPEQTSANNNAAPSRPNSPVALNSLLAAQEEASQETGGQKTTAGEAAAPEKGGTDATQLSEAEQKQVEQLKKNDVAIHRHEQAHAAAGGQYAGAPQYSYTSGPDGQRYANAGHVSIDISPVAGDPKATIEKMDVVQRAANAPAEPSGADRSVAAKAAAAKQTAQMELAQLKAEELSQTKDETKAGAASKPVGETAPAIGISRTDDDTEANSTATKANAAAVKAPPAAHAAAAAAYAAPLNAIAGA